MYVSMHISCVVYINQSMNQSSIRLLQKNIPSDIDAGGIYNKSEANIRAQLYIAQLYIAQLYVAQLADHNYSSYYLFFSYTFSMITAKTFEKKTIIACRVCVLVRLESAE